jgi:tetratricopeptide (TPR) repeat protein|tara:strand:+ start:4411 stop:5607 length:1197 start_codon:yes stop_codon:yes gene_type:complete
MRKLLFITLLSTSFFISSEETISRWMSDYFKRIHDHIGNENYEKAQYELEMGNNNYFRNGRTYEAALLYQLYGQFYAVQSQYTEAVPWFEKALATEKMPRIGAQEVRFQLAQTYFMIGKYENVIALLDEFIRVGERYKYPVSARVNLLMSYSHGRLEQYEPSYFHIKQANNKSDKPQLDWIEYAFSLAMKLEKLDDAEDLGTRLLFLEPNKKKYWNQVSALYFAKEFEVDSLSALELAYENDTLNKESDYLLLAKYYLYQKSPLKSVLVINDGIKKKLIKENEENLKLLSSSYFYARDLENGIKILVKAEKISDDPELSFRLGTYAFDSENYELAISSFKIAKDRGWNDIPGRIELITGISYFELDKVEEARSNLLLATNFEDTKDTAEGWLSYINQF